MAEKTYTMHELMTNFQKAADEQPKLLGPDTDACLGLVAALGFPITHEGYADFDAEMTRIGL